MPAFIYAILVQQLTTVKTRQNNSPKLHYKMCLSQPDISFIKWFNYEIVTFGNVKLNILQFFKNEYKLMNTDPLGCTGCDMVAMLASSYFDRIVTFCRSSRSYVSLWPP